MHVFKLYGHFLIVYFKTLVEYRLSFFMDILIQFTTYGSTYLGIWMVMNRFETIGGWNYEEVIFLYSLNLMSYGICSLFLWSPMRYLQHAVQHGEFDGILIKPLNPMVHLICRQFNQHFIGHILLSGGVLIYCFRNLDISWTWLNSGYFLLAIAGGVFIQGALLIISGAMSFWFVKSNAFTDTMIYGFRGFLDYPITIYNKWIQIFLTFVIPYAFVNFYPAQYFLAKESTGLFHPVFQFATPLIGLLLMLLSWVIWTQGVNKYQSVGS
ncbi:ABC transporter permease [Paenibacillus senegalensis]|uniref:ABC transporter permease n=1 Tax=Paenibacillus senegalensis TaxID=1465766 RepID=UPI00028959EC|nr:ABC-2 family transporter protein [Paenibacillus senegalensis]